MDRPGLASLLDYARKGDTLAVVRLDRFGRSLGELLATVEMLRSRGIDLLRKDQHRLSRWRAGVPRVRRDRAFRAAANRQTHQGRDRRGAHTRQAARSAAA